MWEWSQTTSDLWCRRIRRSIPCRTSSLLQKQSRAELTYAHIGPGSAHNIAGALLNKKAGINVTPVPFQGAGPALQSLLGGHITMSYATIAGVIPYLESKQMKLIALVEPGRIKKMPDVTTINEIVPGVEVTSWSVFSRQPERRSRSSTG